MPPSSSNLSASTVYSRLCWDCIFKQRKAHTTSRRRLVHGSRSTSKSATPSNNQPNIRQFHSDRRIHQQHAVATSTPVDNLPPPDIIHRPIRERLAKWQEEHGNPLSDLVGLDTAFGIRAVVADTYAEPKKDPDDEAKASEDDDEPTSLEYDQEVSQYGGLYLQMGDLVEITPGRNGVPPSLAIYVRRLSVNQIQLITMRGKWLATKAGIIHFSVPGFLDTRLVEPVVPYLPTAEVVEEVLGQTHILDPSVPREVTAPIISALNRFNDASETVYRKYASVLDKAHDMLAHPTDLRFGTLDRITDRLLGQDVSAPRMAAMYAVRRALLNGGMGFGIDRKSHRQTGVFQIRSKEQLKYVTTAISWLRDYQAYEISARTTETSKPVPMSRGARMVKKFIEKATQAIKETRKYRSAAFLASGCLGPSKLRYNIMSKYGTTRSVPLIDFDDEDRVFVRVLEYFGVQKMIQEEQSLLSLLPIILRGTGLYNEEPYEVTLGERAAYAFLQEIGVFAPFENVTHYDVNLLLPDSQHSKPLQQLATTLNQLDITKANLVDNYNDIRKDLENTTAYSIDDWDAHEIDDAISITRIPGTDSKAWLHVHIANPTAFITRDSVFARMAAHLTETFYSADKNVPLLPLWLTQDMLSLASGRPCLTISALVDDRGDILDVKIEHGKLGKVVPVTYSQLPAILGLSNPEPPLKAMVIGGELPQRPRQKMAKLEHQDREDLVLMNKFAKARLGYRVRHGGFSYDFNPPEPSVFQRGTSTGLHGMFPRRNRGMRTDGDPIVEIVPKPYQNPFQGKTGSVVLVQEMMMLAGQAISRWCAERSIPLPYRGLADLPGMPTFREAFNTHVQSTIDKYGEIPVGIGFRFLETYAGQGLMSAKPVSHPSLGLDMYVKATSPLRRYGDMIIHWQIEAALRQEARFGHNTLISKTALASHDQSYLPFDHTQMENIVSRLQPRERLIAYSKHRSIRYWVSYFMFRAYHFKEYPLPPTYRVVCLRQAVAGANRAQSSVNWMVLWEDTGMVFKMWERDSSGNEVELEHGDIWEAAIDIINPYNGEVHLRPITLIQRESDVLSQMDNASA